MSQDAVSSQNGTGKSASGASAGGKWGIYLALDLIAKSQLHPTDRLILLMYFKWVDGRTWRGRPGVPAVAKACGLDPTTVRRRIKYLISIGVILVIEQSRGGVDARGHGRTNCVQLNLHVLARPNPGPVHGLADQVEGDFSAKSEGTNAGTVPGFKLGQPTGGTRAASSTNPGVVPGEPPIHQSTKESTKSMEGSRDLMNAWMGRSESREALNKALFESGVRGENLKRLAASAKLTPEFISAEVERVAADRSVRNRPAVLTRRLADYAGVELKGKVKLGSEAMRSVLAIEELRRKRQKHRESGVISSVVALTEPVE